METVLIYGEGKTRETLECILRGNGYGVCRAENAEELKERFAEEAVSLLFFSIEGAADNSAKELALLARLREENRKPILAGIGEEDALLCVRALNAGADDCIRSSCSVLEYVARIQAQLRCYRRLVEGKQREKVIRMDGLEVDDGAKLVRVDGNCVNLTPTEYKILCLLLEKPGRVLSNRQIYEKIWNMSPIGADNTVAVHIRHIREKIEENPQNPRYLRVVWGQGYKVG